MLRKIINKFIKEEKKEEKNIKIVNGILVEKKEEIKNFKQEKIIEEKEVEEEFYSEDFDNLREGIEKNKGRTKNIEGFFQTLKAAGRSKNTIDTYRYEIKFWSKIAERKKKTVYNLKLKDIEEANGGQDINTVKKRVSALKQLSKWYLRDGFPLLHIECQKIMLAKGKSRIPKAKSEREFLDIKNEAIKLMEEGKEKEFG